MATYWGITPDILADKIAALRRMAVADLEPVWAAEFIPEAMDNAYRDIQSRLLARQYTADQIDAWDYRASYFVDQAEFWALVKGSALTGYPDTEINKLDHRKELEGQTFALGLVINGQLQPPGLIASGGGSVVAGSLCMTTGENPAHSTYRTAKDRRREAQGRGGYMNDNFFSNDGY